MSYINNTDICESIIVGVDFTRGKDVGVLIVGRQHPGKPVEIINAFQGDEAWEMYQKLVTQKPKVKEY